MLAIVAILLIFCVVVRHKWKNAAAKNAAAKKEEILRLLTVASEEEAEITKLQAVDVYYSSPSPPPQIDNQHFCAVCYCPTTTRCSQCKTVRYCSGKCQIVHWRQGHKDECRPASSVHANKQSARVVETTMEEQFAINSKDEGKICSDTTEELDDTGSSSSSMDCFSSSTERSETSFDASTSESLESESVEPGKTVSEGTYSHISQTTSDSDETDVSSPLNHTFKAVNKKIEANKIEKTQAIKTSFEDRRTDHGASVSENSVLGTIEFRNSQSSGSSNPSSSIENKKDQASLTKSKYSGRSDHHFVPNVDIRSLPYSKSVSPTSLEGFWGNEAQRINTETRSLSCRSLENDQKINMRTGRAPTLLSEVVSSQTSTQPTRKALKTSVQKFVQHFRVPKQSKSFAFDMEKNPAGNYNDKIIFPPKLFMQLYSCDGVELHPVGLMNCGNSCYANAVLQCLTFTQPITAFLLQGLHSETCHKRDWCLICEFECLIRKGQEVNSPLSPVGILSQIQKIGSHLSHGREEDAHDFLRNVVDTMQSICLEEAHASGLLAENSTLLGLTFGGYLQSKIKCMKCLGKSQQFDRMMDLTVEIDGQINTLEKALAQFTMSETLAGDDKYKCGRCKSYEKAKKKLTIVEAPNILTIVLKRFRSGNLEKLNKLVKFPEVLNLAPYMSGMSDKYPIYHLYAVVVHLNTMNAAYSGHYISYVKNFRGDWFRIDDSRVSHVDREMVLSAEAYILFYARRSPRGPSLLTNNTDSDGKTKRNIETVSVKKNVKSRLSSSDRRHMESTMVHHRVDYEDWGSHYKEFPHMMDSSSDSSSVFSVSDAGSCSTDSTKDSNAEDISGYIFGSSLHHHL